MKNLHLMLFIPSILSILGGCSSRYAVTFDSNPQGASLICEGKNMGTTPKTLYFKEHVKKQETFDISACSANWVSGAQKEYGVIPVSQYPNGVRQTLERPRGDGYAEDASFALEIRQTEAAENAAASARKSAREAKRQNNKKTTCYTNYGVTTCY